MDYLKRLLDPTIAMSTITNLLSIFLIVGVMNDGQVTSVKSIAGLIFATLIQIGIMKQPNTTK